ncbi:Ni/Fe hydrogenase subunit alpha [Frankia sp. Mgl5]|uniref:Ni/Fe hydrogenase subunit alpha n=1 Tax=Frankia sp. Mgl5 TaxID=2933793 RepID=UPI00200D0E2F|nr:Ni/Fe hydrogenase subunit alpha [Frankia sp. Mgl5]MCK9930597.1 Ni/Fe hydrogenase subunit alpha [Frankia sp. Mgl5]
MTTRTITPPPLARVEGEGRLLIKVVDGRATEVRLKIFEPPRFFEALLRGRAYTEPPDITARICGICPVAYQMSALAAIEQICGLDVDGPAAALRRLIYCGEWIESHALHVFLLHLPDFLGYDSAIHLAQDDPALVENALALKKAGNTLMTVIGGRSIHPVNARVGGWYRAPRRRELTDLAPRLERARDIARDAARFVAGLDFPDDEISQPFVALHQPGEYPVERGRIVSTDGLDIAAADYDRHFTEEQVPWSNALHSTLATGGSYLVGPLARFALNARWLAPAARETAADIGLRPPERNPYRAIVVRCVEMVHAADEALRIIGDYTEPDVPALESRPRAGTGYGVTEAPRGLLYHRYTTDQDGTVLDAKIVPPTSQNQRSIEDDLRGVVERGLDLPEAELVRRCERVVRNYDPCISCATHFLTLHIECD